MKQESLLYMNCKKSDVKKICLIFIFCFLIPCLGQWGSEAYADYVDAYIIEEISYFSTRAGLGQKFSKISQDILSRIEWAKFFNEVYWSLENKNIALTNEEKQRLDAIIKYFDTEYLLLNLSNMLEEKEDFKLGVEYSINSEYLWGEDIRTTILSLYQQLRLIFTLKRKNTLGYLGLRNFGFWGVNEYSSGSVGITFKTSDPPLIEQLYIESGRNFKIFIGRKYYHTGIWGLSVNWLYLPIDMVKFGYYSKNFSISAAGASRYENIDYYIATVGGGWRIFSAELSGFYSAINQATLEKLQGVENDSGASLAISLSPVEVLSFKNEVAIYKKNAQAQELFPYICAVEFDGKVFALMARYGYIPDIKLPTYTISQPPLDFVDKNYIGTRFLPKTQGYNLTATLKYTEPVFFEIEHLNLDKIEENVLEMKNSIRGIYKSSKEGAIIDRAIMDISVVDSDSTEKDSQEWQFTAQLVVKF